MITVFERTKAKNIFTDNAILYVSIEPDGEPIYKIYKLDDNIYHFMHFLHQNRDDAKIYYNISVLLYLSEDLPEKVHLNHPVYERIKNFVNENMPFYVKNLYAVKDYRIKKLSMYKHYPVANITIKNNQFTSAEFIFMKYSHFGEFVIYNNIIHYFDDCVSSYNVEDGIYSAELLDIKTLQRN